MTEAEWLSAAAPDPMLDLLNKPPNDRALRRFAVACARRVKSSLAEDPAQLAALAVAERRAWGEASGDELAAAEFAAQFDARTGLGGGVGWCATHPSGYLAARSAAGLAADLLGEAACNAAERAGTTDYAARETAQLIACTLERKKQADLLRCIVGNPFRPPAPVDPQWLTWNNGAIPALAQAIHDERAFERLPILADALEEAGCTDADVLHHCRTDKLHERGCWVIGWVRDKE